MRILVAAAAFLAACSLVSADDLTGGPAPEDAGSADADLVETRAEATPADDTGADAHNDDAPVDVPDAGPDGEADADAGPSYRDTVLADQPVAYWPLDESVGASIAVDIVGARQAVVTGPVLFGQPGADGKGATFDGSCFLDCGDTLDATGNGAFSLEAWARIANTDLVNHDLISKRASGDGYTLFIHGLDGGADAANMRGAFQANNTEAGASRIAIVDFVSGQAFHHYVVTYDPVGGLHFYFDGIRAPNVTLLPGPLLDMTTPLRFGSGGFVGALDELAFYDKELSAERVRAHFDARKK